jgi:hypothetical protein
MLLVYCLASSMKKLTAGFILIAVCLWAADFWQSKPFTEWSEKDVQKIINSSPWAHEISLSVDRPMMPGGGNKGGMGEARSEVDGPVGGGGGRGGARGGGQDGGAPMTATVTCRWESARPLRQARVKAKYGAEAGTSPEATKFLAQDPDAYVIAVAGPMIRFGGERGEAASRDEAAVQEMKNLVMGQTTLSAKGKDAVKPTNIEVGRGQALFFFPKTVQFTLEDKEVEFSTKVGMIPLKAKFRLKDMAINGKLEL